VPQNRRLRGPAAAFEFLPDAVVFAGIANSISGQFLVGLLATADQAGIYSYQRLRAGNCHIIGQSLSIQAFLET
jgi:hypothetical protein